MNRPGCLLRNLFLILVAAILFSACKKSETGKDKERALVEQTLERFATQLLLQEIDSIFVKYDFNGSMAVFRDSTVLYQRNQGFRDFKKKIPIDSATIFAIASNSKQFTAALVLQQMETGKLALSDFAADYLKSFQNPSYSKITIQQLLNHSSGLNNLGQNLLFEPGTNFHYSNDGFNSLGKIVEKVTGKSYTENVEALFKKAGMTASYSDLNFSGGNFGSAFVGTPQHAEEIPHMPERLEEAVGTPAGGLLSTAADLNRWNQKLYNGKILDSTALNQMTTAGNIRNNYLFGKVGYAGGLMTHLGSPQSFFHTGYVKGAPSLTIYYPETRTSVIILSNLADESKGKRAIFSPHREVKEAADAVQDTWIRLREELLSKD